MRKHRPIRVIAPLLLTLCMGLAVRVATGEDPQPAAENPPSAAETAQRTKIVNRVNRNLGRLKPVGSYQKDDADFFIVGTAKLIKQTGHADVCFQVHQGQRATAEFLYDFMAEATVETPRDWHVFYRLKDGEQAEQALQMTRQQYDQLASYRDQLKQQYRANSIRRC
jgi:hypothetical protein